MQGVLTRSVGGQRDMPRQRTQYGRIVYVFPDDFPQRLVRFKEEAVQGGVRPF